MSSAVSSSTSVASSAAHSVPLPSQASSGSASGVPVPPQGKSTLSKCLLGGVAAICALAVVVFALIALIVLAGAIFAAVSGGGAAGLAVGGIGVAIFAGLSFVSVLGAIHYFRKCREL